MANCGGGSKEGLLYFLTHSGCWSTSSCRGRNSARGCRVCRCSTARAYPPRHTTRWVLHWRQSVAQRRVHLAAGLWKYGSGLGRCCWIRWPHRRHRPTLRACHDDIVSQLQQLHLQHCKVGDVDKGGIDTVNQAGRVALHDVKVAGVRAHGTQPHDATILHQSPHRGRTAIAQRKPAATGTVQQ